MSALIIELFGQDLAEKLNGFSVTKCKIFREEKRVSVGLSCPDVPMKELVDELKGAIRTRFGIQNVELLMEHPDFVLNDETKDAVWENLKLYIAEQYPAAKSLLLHSSVTLSDDEFCVHLKYGGKDALSGKKVDYYCKKLLKEQYGVSKEVSFVQEQMDTQEIFKKVAEEHEELTKSYSEIVSASEKPVKKKVSAPAKDPEAPEDDGVLLGKAFSGDITPIGEINDYSGKVIVQGKLVGFEEREIKNNKTILELFVTDASGSISCKAFLENDVFKEMKGTLKKLSAVCVRGNAQYDSYAKEVIVMARDIMKSEIKTRMDEAETKRVELHAHTSMSALDAICKPQELIARAAKWGHPAIAITDHGVVQAYPEAFDAGAKHGIKIIYGIECYLMGEEAKLTYGDAKMPLDGDFVVFDIETTGFSGKYGEIIEIGAVKISKQMVVGQFSEFVKPKNPIPYHITELTSITNDMVANARGIDEVLPEFLEFCKDHILVAHNANFDVGFIRKKAEDLGLCADFTYVDTLALSRRLLTNIKRHKLDKVAKHLGFYFEGHHRAVNDAEVTAKIFLNFADTIGRMGINDICELNEKLMDENVTKHTDTYHAILLVQNMTGLENLYRLVSESHIDNFYRKPRISKQMLENHRDGLVLGSACEAGELYQAIFGGATKEKIKEIASYYDYLEIQPLGNNNFMLRNHSVNSKADLEEMNREIVELGEALNKPVVATCDVHFLDAEDEIYRRILLSGQDYEDADFQPPLYLRTTEEMLEEFSYLGVQKAKEVVIDNTNRIADMIEVIRPIPKETYAPEMPGAVEEIQALSNSKAHELYGEELPKIVKDRMEKELVPIIKYGFAVMYMIAQKLVAKSLSDGYLVGSRGSVGSSFIAFLSGITEINSLPPHYICPNCKNTEFILDGRVSCGADLPDMECPECGTKYRKDGYDIPFETFLGFDGDKEPDIDLNFSGDYQPVAHKYTEELFGVGHVFRAGTIGTFAENTAIGYIKKYGEKIGKIFNKAETMHLVKGLEGIKRTTGQHPGGVMIVPQANEIYQFSPIQHPANDAESGIITTHFDYHSISGKLLKLDILGHDDPTVIRMLEDLTGLDARTIPIDDKATMSLFTGTEALGATPEEIGSEVGTYAVPEFGTKFVRQMLLDTKPTTFGELMRISGLSHGTDVWTNNAQDLVRNGTATLPEVICTRDDIMLYLLQHGLPALDSFKIMESVRKGKGLTPENEALMREHNVPEWYIKSCKTIKYMFPKAHAAAYVTMAFRIAYFKVHYPIAFYITYFTVRGGDFDAQLMIHGKEKVVQSMKEIAAKPDATQKEKNVLTILEVCNEMYARGIRFLPIDLYKSHANKFLEEDGAIRPPLNTIMGLSDAVAESIIKAREDGEFISVEDLMKRAKLGKSMVEKLKEYEVLSQLPDSSQVSLFDF
ncbi:MAG: PolC-type DNA polymerase III [Clostridia bacterium]|nr:PolC-type DNA polymerase III [Clostridia bacterium]